MTERPSRAERRRQTERRILDAARELFAERGFERTTIRAVAGAAQVDPALVMQYFGSKQELFDQAVQITSDQSPPEGPEQLTERMLANLGVKINGLPETSLAMLRSMLTHPEAAEAARATLDRQVEQISAAIAAPDARLRAALIITTMVGLTVGHQLLALDALRDTTPDRILDALRPCFQALIAEHGTPNPPPAGTENATNPTT